MIKNPGLLREIEDSFIRHESKRPYIHSLRMFESMWLEGTRLGVLPPQDVLEGIDVDVRIARILNSCLKKPSPK